MNLWGIIKGLLVQEENDRTKQLSVEVDSGATTATRTTLKSAQTTDRTLNLPDADDTLVGKETTDLLKNKQLEDSSTEIVDSADNTKKIVLDAAGDTGTKTTVVSSQTSTDKTLTLPDATDTLMGKATTDTMTNKTVGDDLEIQGTTTSTSKDTGALVVQGGVGVEENLNVGGDTILTGDLTVNGTTTHVNSTNMDVTDKNITINKDGNDASSEGAGLTVERTGTDGSIIYEDALTSKFKAGAVGSEVEIANVSGSQTLTNKTVVVANNTITTAASGNLTSTELNAALAELQGDIDGLGTNKADVDLGNLTSPTAINQDLLPATSGAVHLGSSSKQYNLIHGRIISLYESTGAWKGALEGNSLTSPSGATVDISLSNVIQSDTLGIQTSNAFSTGLASGNIHVETGNSTVSDGSVSGDINLKSGDVSHASNNNDSGDINLETGTVAGAGSRGKVVLKDGSEGTIGNIWTSTGVNGEGNWAAAPATGANTTLSNLTSPTAVNQDIDPDGSGTRALGDVNKEWSTVRSRLLQATSGATVFGEMRTSTTSSASSTASVVAFRGVNIGSDTFFGSVEDTINVDANPTGDVLVESGRKTVGTGDSGNISLQTGTSAGGTQGSIKLKDGSEGTIGKIWTSKGTDGEGEWADASAQGGINYVINNDAEVDISDTSVSGNMLIGRTTSATKIRGDGSFVLTTQAGAVTGDYGQWDLNQFDNFELGKQVFITFDYSTQSTFVPDDVEVILRDNTNSVDVPIFGDSISNTGDFANRTRFVGRAEVASNSIDYSLRIQMAQNVTTPSNMVLDNIKVGPDTLVPGAIITEWDDFTPSFTNFSLGNADQLIFKKRRVGQNMEVNCRFRWGSTTSISGAFFMAIPDGELIDTTVQSLGSDLSSVGACSLLDAGTQSYVGTTRANSSGLINLSVGFSRNSGTNHTTGSAAVSNINPSITNTATPVPWTTNDWWEYNFSVPIDGWSAGAILSTTETLFSTVLVEAKGNAGEVITGGTTNIPFIETSDSSGSWGGSTFTAPKTGSYSFEGAIRTTASSTTAIDIYVNSTLTKRIGLAASSVDVPFSGRLTLQKGDVASLRLSGTLTLLNSGTTHHLSIKEEPDFSTFSVYGQSEILSTQSSNFLLSTAGYANGEYAQMVGNSVTLTQGRWRVTGSTLASWTSVAPNWTSYYGRWGSANGDNTVTVPASVTSANMTLIAGAQDAFLENSTNTGKIVPTNTIIVDVINTASLYLNSRMTFTLTGDAFMLNYITAERIS